MTTTENIGEKDTSMDSEPTKVEITEYETFDEMKLKMNLLRGIYAYGFEKPSSIQQKAIIPMTQGHDIIGQSQSGTGKTATFLISTLQIIDEKLKKPQALILSPTRELSEQIFNVLN